MALNQLLQFQTASSQWANVPLVANNGYVLSINSGNTPSNLSWVAGGTVTSIGVGTGLSSTSGNVLTTTGTLAIVNQTLTPGVYASPIIAINQQGIITGVCSAVTQGVIQLSGSTATVTDPKVTANSTVLLSYNTSKSSDYSVMGQLYSNPTNGSVLLGSNHVGDNNYVSYKITY